MTEKPSEQFNKSEELIKLGRWRNKIKNDLIIIDLFLRDNNTVIENKTIDKITEEINNSFYDYVIPILEKINYECSPLYYEDPFYQYENIKKYFLIKREKRIKETELYKNLISDNKEQS